MIDTDKYEGHTPAPWKLVEEYEEEHTTLKGKHRLFNIGNYRHLMLVPKSSISTVNAHLITDAPLLLAEVKRLQLWSDRIREYFRLEDMMDFYDWLEDEYEEDDEDREYDEGE